jgi:transcriptional regulator with XRE-family HTH domain
MHRAPRSQSGGDTSSATTTATTPMSSDPPAPDADTQRRRELGEFLRTRRERVQPAPGPRRRRAKGLLREEVAERAGVSVTWYTWLEQARPTNPSARVLEGLADALQLAAPERAHLFHLARPDLRTAARPAGALPASLLAVLHGLAPHPVYAIDGCWDVLAWNAPADALFGFSRFAPGERNLLRAMLLDDAWQRLFGLGEAQLSSVVAQFRASTVHADDRARRRALIAALEAESPLFARLWPEREVAAVNAKRKVIRHPVAGALGFHVANFRPDDAPPRVRFAIYTPADAASAARLQALLAPAARARKG